MAEIEEFGNPQVDGSGQSEAETPDVDYDNQGAGTQDLGAQAADAAADGAAGLEVAADGPQESFDSAVAAGPEVGVSEVGGEGVTPPDAELTAEPIAAKGRAKKPGPGTDIVPAVGVALTKMKGAQFSKTGLVLPENATREQWSEAGKAIDTVGDASQFWRGDWYLFGEAHFEGFAQEFSGDSEHTRANLASVCKRVPKEMRRAGLSFRHHEAVAKFANMNPPRPDLQVLFLDIAEQEGLNSDALRARIKQLEAEADKNTTVADGGDTGEGQPGEETVGTAETYVENSRKSILEFIKDKLNWTETQALMLDLRDLLSEQGIMVTVEFADDDMAAALASRPAQAAPPEGVIDAEYGASNGTAPADAWPLKDAIGSEPFGTEGPEDEGDGAEAFRDVERVPFGDDGDGGGDGIDDLVAGLVGGGRG